MISDFTRDCRESLRPLRPKNGDLSLFCPHQTTEALVYPAFRRSTSSIRAAASRWIVVVTWPYRSSVKAAE